MHHRQLVFITLIIVVVVSLSGGVGSCEGPSGESDSDRLYIILYDHTDWHAGRYYLSYVWDTFIKPAHIDMLNTYPDLRIGNQYGGGFYDFWEAQSDEESIKRWEKFQEHVADERVSIVGGTYSQAISAFLHEEAAIRQFTYGIESIKSHLQKDVNIYGFSENTGWAYLPQILKDFGFKGAILRSHWAPFGFPPTHNHSIGYWEGPDGSKLPTIPAYDNDNLKTRYTGMNRGEAEFIGWMGYVQHAGGPSPLPKRIDQLNRYYNEKKAQGIDYVVLSVIEDTKFDEHIEILMPQIKQVDPDGKKYKFMTAEEVFDVIPMPEDPPVFKSYPREWDFSWNAGFHGNMLPAWTNEVSTLLTDVEKLLAFKYLSSDKEISGHEEELDLAWKYLLNAEAHDAYAVSEMTNIAFTQLLKAKQTVWAIKQDTLSSLSKDIATYHAGSSIIVYNTLNFDRKEPVEVDIQLDSEQRIDSIIEASNNTSIPFDVVEVKETGSQINVSVVFIANVPSMGHNTYNIVVESGSQEKTLQLQESLLNEYDNEESLTVDNNYVSLAFNENGEIDGLWTSDGTPILSSGNVEASHYFTANIYPFDKPHASDMYRSEGAITTVQLGNVITQVVSEGKIEEQEYKYTTTIYNELPFVDFRTDFQFTHKGIGHAPEASHKQWGELDENPRRKRLTLNLHPSFQLSSDYGEEKSKGDQRGLWDSIKSLFTGEKEIGPWSEDYPLYEASEYNKATNISRYTPFWPEEWGRYSSLRALESWPSKMYNHIYNIESNYWLDISDTDNSRGFIFLTKGTGAYVYDGDLLSMVMGQSTEYVTLTENLRGVRSAFHREPIRNGNYWWDYRLIPHLDKRSDIEYKIMEGLNMDSHQQGISYNNPLIVDVINQENSGEVEPKLQYLSLPSEEQVICSTLKIIDDQLYLRLYEYGGKEAGKLDVSSHFHEYISVQPVSMDFREERDLEYMSITPYHIGTYRLSIEN